jgi:hypothetical protein
MWTPTNYIRIQVNPTISSTNLTFQLIKDIKNYFQLWIISISILLQAPTRLIIPKKVASTIIIYQQTIPTQQYYLIFDNTNQLLIPTINQLINQLIINQPTHQELLLNQLINQL